MRTTFIRSQCRLALLVVAIAAGLLHPSASPAVTTVFFDSTQMTNMAAAGATSDTIRTEGYLFTVTRDKLFTGGVGLTNPIGRNIRVPWPLGLEAQAVTAGPVPSKARIDIERVDGEPFAIQSFTAKLLANTAGAGAAWEIMPMLNGEDGAPEPFMYNATGFGGNQFTYVTPELTGFDAYKMTLYVDFAIMSLTVVDASLPPPRLEIVQVDATTIQLSWPVDAIGYSLESTTDLAAPVWSPVTNNVVVGGEFFAVQLSVIGDNRFYRLRKQGRASMLTCFGIVR